MTQPLIILGMHRSGTSMLTRVLRARGLFTGHVLTKHAEAQFFYELNEAMLGATGASWDRPGAALRQLDDPAAVARLAALLRGRLRGLGTWGYLGPRMIRARGRIGPHLRFAWGWKDPRNSLFLPVWLEVFGEARLLRIRRHGIDVAASLLARELRRAEPRFCRTIADGLELWSEYETALDRWLDRVPSHRQMTVRFEDYAADCTNGQAEIDAFAGLSPLGEVSPELRPAPERALSYRRDPALREEAARHAAVLRKHGYQP
jgi:hypothetical protein